MNGEAKGWDRNLRLEKGFWLILATIGPLILFLTWHWMPHDPLYALIAGCILFPFLTSILIYTFWRVIYLCFFKKEIERVQIRALVITLLYAVAIFGIAYACKISQDHLSSLVAITAFSSPILYGFLSGKFSKRSS